MRIDHQYLLFALALILVATNCVGAAFTLRRNFLERNQPTRGTRPPSAVGFGWAKTYGRLALAQGVGVVLALGATALGFSHSIIKFLGL